MNFIETIGWIFIGGMIIILVALLYMIPTWLLWNWLCPKIFGLPEITLLQSLGILILTGILFRNSSSKNK